MYFFLDGFPQCLTCGYHINYIATFASLAARNIEIAMVYELFHLFLFNHRKKCVFIFLVVRQLTQNFFMRLPLTKEEIHISVSDWYNNYPGHGFFLTFPLNY